MLNFRPASTDDAPAFWGLIDDYKDVFLSDYDSVDPSVARFIIETGNAYVIEAFGYPVGAVWYNDQYYDLHISLHLIVRPAFLRDFIREKLAYTIVDLAFDRYKVKKIKGFTLKKQSTARTLMLKYGFVQRCWSPRDTRQGGKYSDVFIHELANHNWRYFKKHPEKVKKRKKPMDKQKPETPVEKIESELTAGAEQKMQNNLDKLNAYQPGCSEMEQSAES